MIWATDKDIGYNNLGAAPIKSNDKQRFCKGYDSSDDILEFLNNDDQPIIINPDKGFIVTANNKPYPSEHHYNFNGYFFFNRFHRITEMIQNHLSQQKKFSIEDNTKMMDDVKDS